MKINILKQLKASYRTALKKQKMRRFYSQILKEGHLVFDCGANHGRYTQLYLELGAKVIAIEPHPSCLNSLKNIQSSKLSILPVAIADKEGTLTLMLCNEDEVSTLSTEFKEEYAKQEFLNWDTQIQVATMTFDQLIESHGRPDYLKIDIEGFEHIALRALSTSIPIISFEFTRPFRRYAIECINLISKIGDYKFNYYTFENFEFCLEQAVPADEMIHLIMDLDDSILVGDIYCFLEQ